MGKRNTARRLAMQALYQADITGINIETAIKNISEAEKLDIQVEEKPVLDMPSL